MRNVNIVFLPVYACEQGYVIGLVSDMPEKKKKL